MTSTFVSGPTVQSWHGLQLNQLVNNEILHYRASLTAAFRPSWKNFDLRHGTCWVTIAFGSTSEQFCPIPTGTGLTALHLMVIFFCLYFYCATKLTSWTVKVKRHTCRPISRDQVITELRAYSCHIIECYRPTVQVNTLRITPAGDRYSTNLPWRDWRLSWPRWLVHIPRSTDGHPFKY